MRGESSRMRAIVRPNEERSALALHHATCGMHALGCEIRAILDRSDRTDWRCIVRCFLTSRARLRIQCSSSGHSSSSVRRSCAEQLGEQATAGGIPRGRGDARGGDAGAAGPGRPGAPRLSDDGTLRRAVQAARLGDEHEQPERSAACSHRGGPGGDGAPSRRRPRLNSIHIFRTVVACAVQRVPARAGGAARGPRRKGGRERLAWVPSRAASESYDAM